MTLNIIFSVIDTYEPYPTIFHLHLNKFILIPTRNMVGEHLTWKLTLSEHKNSSPMCYLSDILVQPT